MVMTLGRHGLDGQFLTGGRSAKSYTSFPVRGELAVNAL
jgi:hypothetical protein